jgi:transposase
MRAPGPLRAFDQRVRARCASKIATVAVARKLACLTWQLQTKQQDYIYERPALTSRKLRSPQAHRRRSQALERRRAQRASHP